MNKRAVVAFIPLRGDSKSIPLKNIKNFCGLPLCWYAIYAAIESKLIDHVVVATDSDKIVKCIYELKKIISDDKARKIVIYDRYAKNAKDVSTTESVMLEWIYNRERKNPNVIVNDNSIFVLIQATNPFITEDKLDDAIKIYKKRIQVNSGYSMLSVNTFNRFLWGKIRDNKNEVNSINYDHFNRLRRQDIKLNDFTYIENGSFYISTIINIKSFQNRLTNNIGIYDMKDDYSWIELDSEKDWDIAEFIYEKRDMNEILHSKKRKRSRTSK